MFTARNDTSSQVPTSLERKPAIVGVGTVSLKQRSRKAFPYSGQDSERRYLQDYRKSCKTDGMLELKSKRDA